MSSVQLSSPAPAGLLEALEEIGVAVSPDAGVAITVWPEGVPQPKGPPTIALVAGQDCCPDAIAAGAVVCLRWPEEQHRLGDVLLPILRSEQHLRRRMRRAERDSRRALAELQSTRDLLGRLIDATPDPVMAVDLRGRVLVFNRAAESALGYDAAWALAHMHVTDVYVDRTEARRVLSAIRNSPDGIVQHLEARLRARSGEQLPVSLSAAEVYAADGMPIGTVGVFMDRRRELALRERLEQTTAQLIASERRAAHVDVAGAAANELNQPLTAVMGALEMVDLRSDLPGDVKDRLGRAYLQLDRMADIVRRLALSTRPDAVGSGDHGAPDGGDGLPGEP